MNVFVLTLSALLAAPAPAARAAAPLTIEKTVTIPGGPGGFDWMLYDGRLKRIFATHKGTKTVAIVDAATDKVIDPVTVGTAQGVAIDRADNKIFLGDDEEHKVVAIDYTTLKPTGDETAVTGPVDDLIFCAKNSMLYAAHDDGTDIWVIDPKTNKIVTSVQIPAAPEKMLYDRTSDRIYANIKSNNTIQVIDPSTNKVEKTISTLPAEGPHGLVADGRAQHLFSAGSNGKLVEIDIKSGAVISSVDIAKGVDQIAFDRSNHRIYCACHGEITVAEISDSGLSVVGSVKTPSGCHTITVDSSTHAVWTCGFDKEQSYFVKLVP